MTSLRACHNFVSLCVSSVWIKTGVKLAGHVSTGIMRKDILRRKSEIEIWIAENRSKAFICRELGCKPETLERYLSIPGFEYGGNQGARGKKVSPFRKPVWEFLRKDSFAKSHKLKLRLIEAGLKQRGCERCGNCEWLGLPIPIELHHINGNRFDNRLENLQVLCPNCHALTDNHAGKASGRYKGTYPNR